MFCNEGRKKYTCKLLSCILDNTYEELMDNTTYYKNELDKDSKTTKSERVDLIVNIGNSKVNVEMNMRNEIERNIEYLDRIYRYKVREGKRYTYTKVLSINLNNFYFKDYDKIVDIYYIQNDEKILLTHKTIIQIYLPKLVEKWYNSSINELTQKERAILAMLVTDNELAKNLSKGDEIMSEYVKEIKDIEIGDNYLREAYDKELSYTLAAQESGYQKGIKEGIDYGKQQERAKTLEIAKKLYKKGTEKEEIIELFGLDTEEIKLLK